MIVMAKIADQIEKISRGVTEGYKTILNNRKRKFAPQVMALSEKFTQK